MNGQTYVDRANFLAAVAELGEGDEIAQAAFELAVEVTAQTPAPWADTDPQAAEHWLLVHGARPSVAAANAAEFELKMRAIVGIVLGRPVRDFGEIATYLRLLSEAR